MKLSVAGTIGLPGMLCYLRSARLSSTKWQDQSPLLLDVAGQIHSLFEVTMILYGG